MVESPENKNENRHELVAGLIIAVFAAVLSLNELGAGKFGDDEKQAIAEKGSDYAWYQSKSIKASLLKGQRDLVSGLIDTGVIPKERAAAVESGLQKQVENLDRYSVELEAIQNGYRSAAATKGYAKLDGKRKAEFDAEFKQVEGFKARGQKAETLGRAGDRFDIATLFLQIGLVLGAVSLLVRKASFKRSFLMAMVALGLIGAFVSLSGFMLAFSLS